MEEIFDLSFENPNIIVAYTDKNRFIGNNGDLIWGRKLKGDFNFMKNIIRIKPNAALIMGRKTFESMPLIKNIKLIVLSRNSTYSVPAGVVALDNFEEALKYCNSEKLYPIVFGGEKVYESALKHKCKIFSTVVEENGMIGDSKYPIDNADLKNITNEVNEYLISNGVKQTWTLKDDSFIENNIVYRFYLGYN